jgi:cytochrome b involved in lipid metabolism
MRKSILTLLTLTVLVALNVPANAHQPVALLNSDTTAAKGPLLVDGTVSFAVRASFSKSGQKKAFRAGLKEGDDLAVQLLIVDKKPENKLKISQLPTVVITDPMGARTTLKVDERTKFYEPYSSTNYLYLSRYTATAKDGIYSFTITSRAKSAVTIAVGQREVQGEVRRGPATPVPMPTPITLPGFTMEQVKANNTAQKCWSVIDSNVYDLTSWIMSHPGGASAISSLCGIDGTAAFKAQHVGQERPTSRLAGMKLGPLTK